jgi:hypothetical protein
MAACIVSCLAPATVLADANPNNHGHHYHYGWAKHHSPTPTPTSHPSGGGTGVTSYIAGVPAAVPPQAPVTGIPPTLPELQPPGTITTTASLIPSVPDAWLVAILLGTVLAANVALGVWAAGRGGHFALRRVLAPVGITL